MPGIEEASRPWHGVNPIFKRVRRLLMSNGSKRKKKGGRKSTKVFAGRYAYKKPLGRGAGGSVYLAEDMRFGDREVALKVLSAEACETVQGKMLRREFEILSKLNHPNLVRVYDYGSLPDGGIFLAEEYIDGFSLQDARALLEPQALIDPTLQILQGLSYLHAMGMIHRDIKPANVMLLWLDDASARPMVKLVDFGLSSMNPKRDTLRGGTRSYMAPEIIRGDKAEKRSDLYSLGVTLYYALCGVLPFGPRSKKDPPPTEEDFRPPEPHRLNEEVPLALSRFTMALLRQLSDVDYADAGEALQALAADAGALEKRSVGQMANSLDVSAAPVIRGFFERGILSRRIDEDDLLLEWLSMAKEPSQGQLYLIRGDEGVGKSRLLQDVQASAKLSGHQVLTHQADELDGSYSLVTEMLEQLIALASSQGVVAVEKYWPPLSVRKVLTQLGERDDEATAHFINPSWIRDALQHSLSMLKPQQVVFFIDDIDGADEDSLQMLGQWFDALKDGERPAIVATTARGELYRRFSRKDGVQVLPIEGVGRGDVEAFFHDQLGLEELSDAWLDSVDKAAEGRPAYIEELCRYLIDAGMLWRESAQTWKARSSDIEASGVPATFGESLRRRITAVGASGRECLELLALIDRKLAWESARRLLERGGCSPREADRTLRRVQWRHLVTMELTPTGRYVGVIHHKLASAVSDMTSPQWRRALHRRIGEEVVRDWRQGQGSALEAATHLEQGGRKKGAAPYFEIAGDSAVDRGEQRAARAHYTDAIEGATEVEAQAMLHLKLARCYLAGYEPQKCQESLHKAVQFAEKSQRSWLQYRVCVDAAHIGISVGDVEMARDFVEKVRTDITELAGGVEVEVVRAQLEVIDGSLDDAAGILNRCLVEADVGGNSLPHRLVDVLSLKANVDILRGEAEEGLGQYRRARRLIDWVDDSDRQGILMMRYGRDLRRLDRPVEAQDLLVDALTLLAGGSAPHMWIETLFQLAWTLTDLGSSTQATQRAREAFYFARLLGHKSYEHKAAVLLGSLVLSRQQAQEDAIEKIDAAVDVFSRGEGFVGDRAEVLMALGDLMITLQMKERGPKLLQRGRQMAYKMGAKGLLPPVEE